MVADLAKPGGPARPQGLRDLECRFARRGPEAVGRRTTRLRGLPNGARPTASLGGLRPRRAARPARLSVVASDPSGGRWRLRPGPRVRVAPSARAGVAGPPALPGDAARLPRPGAGLAPCSPAAHRPGRGLRHRGARRRRGEPHRGARRLRAGGLPGARGVRAQAGRSRGGVTPVRRPPGRPGSAVPAGGNSRSSSAATGASGPPAPRRPAPGPAQSQVRPASTHASTVIRSAMRGRPRAGALEDQERTRRRRHGLGVPARVPVVAPQLPASPPGQRPERIASRCAAGAGARASRRRARRMWTTRAADRSPPPRRERGLAGPGGAVDADQPALAEGRRAAALGDSTIEEAVPTRAAGGLRRRGHGRGTTRRRPRDPSPSRRWTSLTCSKSSPDFACRNHTRSPIPSVAAGCPVSGVCTSPAPSSSVRCSPGGAHGTGSRSVAGGAARRGARRRARSPPAGRAAGTTGARRTPPGGGRRTGSGRRGPAPAGPTRPRPRSPPGRRPWPRPTRSRRRSRTPGRRPRPAPRRSRGAAPRSGPATPA